MRLRKKKMKDAPLISPIAKNGIITRLSSIGEVVHKQHSPHQPAPDSGCYHAGGCGEISLLRKEIEILELPS